MISQSALPLHFWPYAFSTAIYVINRLPPSRQGHCSPWELLFHRKPSYELFKPFGCLCYPLLRHYNQHKLQPRSVKCIFLGYATNAKGYICFDPKSHKFYTSRHVHFTESVFPFNKNPNSKSIQPVSPTWLQTNLFFHECPLLPIFGSGPTSPSILGPIPSSSPQISPSLLFESIVSNTESVTSTPIVPDPSPSQPIHSNPPPPVAPQTSQHPMQTRAKSGIFKPKRAHNTTTVDYLNTEPPNFKTALQYPQWHEAMTSEFQALQRQATWTLVPPSQTHNLVGCRWVYKLK